MECLSLELCAELEVAISKYLKKNKSSFDTILTNYYTFMNIVENEISCTANKVCMYIHVQKYIFFKFFNHWIVIFQNTLSTVTNAIIKKINEKIKSKIKEIPLPEFNNGKLTVAYGTFM